MTRMLLAAALLTALAGGAQAAAPPRDFIVHQRMQQLRHGDVLARQDAAFALGQMGPRAQLAIPALIECLRDPDLRRPATLALGRIGPAALPALLSALRDKDEAVGAAAARGLTEMGSPAVMDLIQALKNPGPAQELAAGALGGMGPKAQAAIPALVCVLCTGRWTADIKLVPEDLQLTINGQRMTLDVPSVETRDNQASAREAAADALEQIGPAAVPPLIALLVQRSGAPDWPNIVRIARSGCAALPEVLKDPDEDAALFRILVLASQLGAHAPLLRGCDPITRRAALRVLQSYREAAGPALPVVVKALYDPDSDVRVEALKALAHMGPAAYPAARALADCLRDPAWAQCKDFPLAQALETLGRLGSAGQRYLRKEVFPNLLATLRRGDPQQLQRVLPLLRHLRREDLPASSELVQLFRAQVPDDWSLVAVLASIDNKATVRLLIELQTDARFRVRFTAANYLYHLGPPAGAAIPTLLRIALAPEDEFERRTVLWPVLAIDPCGPQTIRALIAILSDKDPGAVAFAADALAQAGPAAGPAVCTLRALLGHDKAEVRVAAAGALVAAGDIGRPIPGGKAGDVSDIQQILSRSTDLEFLRAAAPHHPIATLLLEMASGEEGRAAALGLSRGGPAALRHAGRFLGQLYAREDQRSEVVRLELLKLIDSQRMTAAAPYLQAFLGRITPDHPAYGPCLAVLERLQPDPAEIVPLRLRQLLSRGSAGQGYVPPELARWGADAAPALPRLMALLWDADGDCRAAAAYVLGRIGPAAQLALTRLRAARADESPRVRLESAIAVARLSGDQQERRQALQAAAVELPLVWPGTNINHIARDLARDPMAARTAVSGLMHLLESPDRDTRRNAVRVLAALGPAVGTARSALRALQEDFWPHVANAARDALRSNTALPDPDRQWPDTAAGIHDIEAAFEALRPRSTGFVRRRCVIP